MTLKQHLIIWKRVGIATIIACTILASVRYAVKQHYIYLTGREAVQLWANRGEIDWVSVRPLLETWDVGGKEAFIIKYLNEGER